VPGIRNGNGEITYSLQGVGTSGQIFDISSDGTVTVKGNLGSDTTPRYI